MTILKLFISDKIIYGKEFNCNLSFTCIEAYLLNFWTILLQVEAGGRVEMTGVVVTAVEATEIMIAMVVVMVTEDVGVQVMAVQVMGDQVTGVAVWGVVAVQVGLVRHREIVQVGPGEEGIQVVQVGVGSVKELTAGFQVKAKLDRHQRTISTKGLQGGEWRPNHSL